MIWEASLGKKTLIYLFYSLSLFIAKIFFSVCFFDSKKMCEHNVDKRITNRKRYKQAKIWKRRNQKKIPTPKTEVEKKQTNNQAHIRSLRLLHVL